MATTVCVAVPSFRRPHELDRCLNGLARGAVAAQQVVVVLRPDDVDGRAVARERGVTIVDVLEAGHLPPLVAALEACEADVLAIIDDDAVPADDWVGSLQELFSEPSIVMAGGPVEDSRGSMGYLAGRLATRRLRRRQGLTWYGGLGGLPDARAAARLPRGSSLPVAHLTGCNMAIRAQALRRSGVDMALNRGAAIAYEADLCLVLRRQGRVVFNTGLVVEHRPAARRGAPPRDAWATYATDYTYDLFYIAGKHWSRARQAMLSGYMAGIGQGVAPGWLRRLALRGDRRRNARTLAGRLAAGRRAGLRDGRSSAVRG